VTSTILASIPSPAQGVWHIWIIPIRAYALCIIAGIIAALVIGDRRWVARGGEPGVIYDIALWAVPFGLIGGRLYHVMTDWPTYFGDTGLGFFAALRIWDGGLGIWGAVALGGVGAWIGCRMNGIPLPAFGDAIAPGIVLAQAIGRVGNYFNQELYGGPTNLPWGLEIFKRVDVNGASDMLNGVSTGQLYEPTPVHPTFLYELLWNLLVFAVLIWADRRFKLGHGRLFAMYVAGYCVGRFWVELMRTDHANTIAGIRINTFTSTFVFIGAVIYIMVATKGREDPATLRGKQADEDEKADEGVEVLAAVGATSAVAAAATGAGAEGGTEPAGDEKPSPDAEEAEADDEAPAEAEESTDDAESEAVVEPGEEAEPEAGDEAEAAEPEAEATEAAESEEPEVEAEDSEADDAEDGEAEADEPEAAEPEAGLGSVDGEELAAAEEAAPEVHDAVVEQAEEAEDVAAEDESEAEEPEAEAAESDDEAEAVEPETAESVEPEVDAAESDGEDSETDDAEADAEVAVDKDDEAEAVEPETAESVEPEVDAAESDGEDSETDDAEAEEDKDDEAEAVEPETAEAAEPEVVDDSEPDAPAAQAAAEPRRRWWRRGS